jgi:Chaperone of endosialidase/Major tropism determinant N-terminal domain
MATQVQFRRGTAVQHASFTGAVGELTVNTTNKSAHIHDGTTSGGFELARADLSNTSGLSLAGLTTISNLKITNDFYVSGVSTFVGAVTFQGGTITLGDANTDNVVFTADVNSNIVPNTDNSYDLGSSSQQWRHIYSNGTADLTNLYVSGIGTIITLNCTTGTITNFSGTIGTITNFSGTIGTITNRLNVGSAVTISGGIITATTFSGTLQGNATTASSLQNSRTIELTGDVIGAVLFDGSSNVSIAATIQPNSVGLGTDTTGEYVQSISGTANQITVTSGTGESSTPILSIPNQFTAPQDVRVSRDLQVDRNLNVNGSITIGGTSAYIAATELKVSDPDIVLGFRTDSNGNDISTDNTANHGGIAIASTEGTPLVTLYDVGIGETSLSTYKKFMWFKSGTFSGLGTDAWLSNYAIGIGSTQMPNEARLAVGRVIVNDDDISKVRNINATGIVTALDFNATSDINLKTNIKPIENALDKIVRINGVTFDWKENNEPSVGVIAQEVEEVFPQLVKTSDHKSLNYNGLIGALIEAIKDQQNQIDDLRNQIQNLKK